MKKIFWIDLFCGAGGTSSGIQQVSDNVQVIACVNHDPVAIESHAANHPGCIHFTEDIRDMKVVKKLAAIVEQKRQEYKGCLINIWASLECTNYSKAKGGQPRDADSRTLAEHLPAYLKSLNPDYLYIENVREFMAWGPLDTKGKPISRKNGRDYIRWVKGIQKLGYNYDWKLLNSADFGAYTSRQRYFGQFARKGMPVSWPTPTHIKKKKGGTLLVETRKDWLSVRDVLDLQDEGRSIFTRKKPLCENTLKRIYAGLEKFVAGGHGNFIKRYNGGDPKEKVKSLDIPLGTITTANRHRLVKVVFLKKYFSGKPKNKVISIDAPAGTITCNDHHAVVSGTFLQSYYGNGQAHDIQKPCATLTTKDRFAKVLVQFIDQQYSASLPKTIEEPTGAITTNPKFNLTTINGWIMDTNFGNVGQSTDKPLGTIVACRKHHYLLNPQFGNKGADLDKPCFTLIARMDKKPPYLVTSEALQPSEDTCLGIVVYPEDSEYTIKIKEFMAAYGLVDIKMRMLKISELKVIQGFPENYILKGAKKDQKKFIGNSVVPVVARVLAQANYRAQLAG